MPLESSSQVTFMGRPIEELTKEELIEVVRHVAGEHVQMLEQLKQDRDTREALDAARKR